SAGSPAASGQPLAAARRGHYPPLQGPDAPGRGPAGRLRLPGHRLYLAVRRRQGHHRLPLQRLSLLPPSPTKEQRMSDKKTRNRTAPLKTVRCAVYTRKSTEERTEQEFTSCHAQREAAEAYIKSQDHERWLCLPDPYDDGGFTGGNMERPAVARLWADIDAGKIDAVVVYKVDRLSRSLLDFAKMMVTFEQHHVAFVSVTQQFNT